MAEGLAEAPAQTLTERTSVQSVILSTIQNEVIVVNFISFDIGPTFNFIDTSHILHHRD